MSPSLRGVAAIAGGMAGGQLVALAAIPLISRLFTPAEFGIYSLLTSLSVVAGSAMSLRMEKAIPLPKNETHALAVTQVAILIVLASVALGLVLAFAFGERFATLFNAPGSSGWWWTVPLAGGLSAMFAVLSQLAIRYGNYRALGIRNFLQPTVMSVAQLGLGAVVAGPGGLIFGSLAGRSAGLLGLLGGKTLISAAGAQARRPEALGWALHRYWRFPAIATPAGLLNTIGLQVPTVLIAWTYSESAAGSFGMANTIAALPVTLLAISIGQVYLSEFARRLHVSPSAAHDLFTATTRRLLVLAGIVGLLLHLLSTVAFPLVLGERWHQSGEIAQSLAILVALRFIASPMAHTLPALELQGRQFALDALRVAVIAGVFAWARVSGAPLLAAVGTYSASMALVYALTWAVCWQAVRAHRRNQPRA